MKRINVLLLSLVLIFGACSFKQKADSRIKNYVSSVIPDPDFSIEDKETEWEDDSLCIIDFKLRAKNIFGGYEITDYEYVLVRSNSETFEVLINIKKKAPIYSRALEYFRNLEVSQKDGEYEMVLHMIAFEEASRFGRKLPQ